MDIIKPYHPRSQSPSMRVRIFLERSYSYCHMTSPRCPPKGVSVSIGCELHQIPNGTFLIGPFSVHHRMHMLLSILKPHAALLPAGLPACIHNRSVWSRKTWCKLIYLEMMVDGIFYTCTIQRACKREVYMMHGRTLRPQQLATSGVCLLAADHHTPLD